MKNVIVTLVVLGAILTGSNALAGEPKILPSEKPRTSTLVTFENVKFGAILYIKDTLGYTLYTEKIKNEGSLTKNFDLTQLPENEYFFEIDKKDAITQIPINIENGKVNIYKELEKTFFKPSLELNGEIVTLSRKMDGTASYNIKVLYEGEDLAYKEAIEIKGDLKRTYDFSTSITGKYLFSIEYDNFIYNEYVNIITMN